MGPKADRAKSKRPRRSLKKKSHCSKFTHKRKNCPSPFKRKKEKQGTNVTHETQQHQPGRKAPTYEDVPEYPVYATVSKPKSVKQDDSIHYADIQVFTKARERSAAEVKNLQMQNATEYATLNFPRPRLKYDSKNGTLV